MSLCRRSGPTLSPVGKDGAPYVVRALVDSGAEESVTPPGLFQSPVVPSTMSLAGQTFSGADGTAIPNLGRTTVDFTDTNGRRRGMHFQVAGVTQPLVSVAGLVDAGNVVIFDAKGGLVHHRKSGRQIRLPREGNTFLLDMEVASKPEEEGGRGGAAAAGALRGGESAPAFRRPE